jgi:hypothetical protein
MGRQKSYRVHSESDAEGWSDAVTPIMDGYRMSCCDCGLVHEMEFRAVRKGRNLPDGSWRYKSLNKRGYRVAFRARRDEKATAAVRREKKKREAKRKSS